MRLTDLRATELSGELNRKHSAWKLHKLPFEGNHFLNMAFYYGFQWTLYNITTAELQEVDNPAGNIRVTSNQIQPRIRNLHAKMLKNKPIIEVVPTSYQLNSIFSAQISRKLLDQWRQDHNEDEKDSEIVDWLLICGNAARKIGFDPTAGPVTEYEKEQYREIIYDERTGQPDADAEDFVFKPSRNQGQFGLAAGELFDEVVPSFELLFPEYPSDFDITRELMHVKLMPLADFQAKWGRRAKDIAPSKDITFSSHFQRRLLNMANPEVSAWSGGVDSLLGNEPMVFVTELWRKPSKKYPKGQIVIGAGDGFKVVYAEDNPYHECLAEEVGINEGLPFIWYKCINAPGRIWDISPVEGMRPIQVEYNKTISDIIQNRATLGRNKIVAPKTANIDPDEVSNIHGQFLQFSGIIPPQIFPAAALPQQVERETERNRLDLDTISGSHEVSRAQVPSGVKSGIAINYLLEQDETTLAPIIHAYERSKLQLARAKLAIAKHFYGEGRLLKATSMGDPVEVLSFSGSDISTNLRVTVGSALPKSRAALQATILDLWDRKAIVDEQMQPDPKKLFRLLKDSMGVDLFSETENLDLERTRRENMRLMQMEQILPMPWEDHRVHIEEHNRFRKSEEFYQLPKNVQQNFDIHISIHMQMLAPPTATPGAEEMMMLMGGGGGGGRSPARLSPSMAGQGSMGALNNPPGNYGVTGANK